MKTLFDHFARMVAQNHIEIFIEFSLQHEFGIFIRNGQRDYKVQFERNVSFFFDQTNHSLKKEIDRGCSRLTRRHCIK